MELDDPGWRAIANGGCRTSKVDEVYDYLSGVVCAECTGDDEIGFRGSIQTRWMSLEDSLTYLRYTLGIR